MSAIAVTGPFCSFSYTVYNTEEIKSHSKFITEELWHILLVKQNYHSIFTITFNRLVSLSIFVSNKTLTFILCLVKGMPGSGTTSIISAMITYNTEK